MNDPLDTYVPILGLDAAGELSGDDPLVENPLPWPYGREDRWTELHYAPDHVLIAERRPPRWLYGGLAMGLTAFLLASPYLPIDPKFALLLFVFLGYMLWLSFRQVYHHRFFRCYLCRPSATVPEDGANAIPTTRIAAIIVRENNLRDDESRLVQVVLRLTDPDEYLLIYRSYYAWRKSSVQTAQELQAWLAEETSPQP